MGYNTPKVRNIMSISNKTREKLLRCMRSLRIRFAHERAKTSSLCWEELDGFYRAELLLQCKLHNYKCGTLFERHHLYSVSDILDEVILDLVLGLEGFGSVVS
jgi:hypothetical protein